jgi:cytochrome c-type biogenesis protein CcmH/NrfG
MLDYALWGYNPLGYILANISYHFMSGVLLYFILLRHGFWKWGAVIGSALFLVHPVQVESVAWLSQRKNVLAMLFYLLAFHAYLSYRENEGRAVLKWYLCSIFMFTAALLSKSVAVIFPMMLILHDVLVPRTRRRFREHADKIPYFIAAGVIGVLAIFTQIPEYGGGGRVNYPPGALIVLPLSMLPVLVKYLQLLVWPALSQMSVMYFPPLRSTLDWDVLIALCVVAGLLVVGGCLYRRSRPTLFWYALFFLGLLPVSQIIPLITMMNDRYLYFPMLGIAGLVASFFSSEHSRTEYRAWWKPLVVVSAALVIVISVVSHLRGRVWRNTITLFSDTVEKYQDKSGLFPLCRLAEGYVASGDLKIARYYYEKAGKLGPLDFDATYNLVQILFEEGDFASAYQHIWRMLLGGDPDRRGQLLLGEYYYRTGDYQDAESYLLSYLEDYPESAHGLFLLGQVYLVWGMNERAGELLRGAVSAGGNHAGLYFSIACSESRQGRTGKALEAMQTAFEKGFTARDMKTGEWCLDGMRDDSRFQEMVRRYLGSNGR